MTHRKREIPWIKVVQFHAEIARRHEETFFALPLSEPDSERWSSLTGFRPASLSGPWSVPQKTVVSKRLTRLILNESLSGLFLGGPCWFKKRRDQNGVMLDWQPIIYREVRVELDSNSEDVFQIIPEKGNWDISPLVFRFMDNKEIQLTKPLDKLLPEFIERASLKSEKENRDLTDCLIEEFTRAIPELGHELYRETPKVKSPPSTWILFAPLITSTGYNKNLIRDYEQLEKQLESNPDQIGGLRLLEDPSVIRDQVEKDQVEILPFVPLNPSQHAAVTGILESRPVTVISGPPGCGKSQVVVSVLLNAWAKGMSVLFTSTINQAVDVVREKFEPLESDFPIAIRAGKKEKNNIEETVRRTLNIVAAGARSSGTDNSTTAKRLKELTSKKNGLLDSLKSQIPQRVDQALRSALKAYGQYKTAVQELSDARELQVNKIKELGYDITPDEFTATLSKPLREWLGRINKYREIIEQDSHDRSQYLKRAASSAEARNFAVQQAGLDPGSVTDWNWLTSGPGYELVEAWLESYRSLLSQPLEQRLAPIDWKDEFNDWNNEMDACNWSQSGRQLVKNIRSICGELSTRVAEIEDIKDRLNEQSRLIMGVGIPDDIQIDPNLLSEWLAAYTAELTLPKGTFDWLPWSERSKLIRKLHSIEVHIRPTYPLSIWQKIGEINKTGRKALSEIIETNRNWIAIRDVWDGKKAVREEIENRLGTLREAAIELRINKIPAGTDLSAWLKLAETIEAKANVADNAAVAWNKSVIAEQTREHLQETAHKFQSIGSGVPIKEAWIQGPGHAFTQSVLAPGVNPAQNEIISARTALYNKSIDPLLKAWREARDAEIESLAHTAAAEKIPSESSRITDWWNEKPLLISIQKADFSTLPDDDDELWKHLISCEDRDAKWKLFVEKTLPDREKRCNEELSWAINLLKKALETVPDGEDKIRIGKTVQPLLDGLEKVWPVDELFDLFKIFRPDRIKGRINEIDAQLGILSFDLAKDYRLKAVADDIEAQKALEALSNHYRKNYGRIEDSSYELFSEALRAVPVWITTAQSPQSIPMQPEVFDLLVIDEATQCTLTNLLPMIYRAKRIAVIGDPEQLPAISTISNEAEKSLAEKFNIAEWLPELLGHAGNDVYKTAVRCLPRWYADVISLVEHYRSHSLIIGFANQYIYQRRLRLNKEPNQSKEVPYGAGVHGMQVNGYCKRGPGDKSWINPPEKDAVCKLVKELRAFEGFGAFTIGVVTPFKPHKEAIEEELIKSGLDQGVTVGTAHTFQGDERDVMIFSPVVAKGITDHSAEFVENPHNLINVAVTRGKEVLFVVGDLKYCRQQKGILGKLTEYVETVSKLRKTSPCELELFSWMILQGWDPQVHVQVGDIEVDFILNNHGIKLVIEADGETIINQDGEIIETHINEKSKDASRDAFLMGQGYKVQHFKCRAIRETPSVVIHDIAKALELDWTDDMGDITE